VLDDGIIALIKALEVIHGNKAMNRIVLKSRVGADGVLQLSVPFGVSEADRQVEVTIEPADTAATKQLARDEWRQFVTETAGAWQGDLVRPEPGNYEHRDELP
jgi:hypothetical protein